MIALTKDSHPQVAITAAWALMPFHPKVANESLKHFLNDADPDVRQLAASVIGKSGKNGHQLGLDVLKATSDPYVRMNIALGLMGQEVAPHLICDTLHDFLSSHQEDLMWDRHVNPLFPILSKSHLRHIPQVPQYPLMVDQLTRLELLRMLAIKRFSKAEEGIREFLKRPINEVVFTASMTLIEEGGGETIDILKDLLKDEEETIRVQAALVLAIMGGDKEALHSLEAVYFACNRETKLQILSAIGHLGQKESIPFLLKRLEEPFQVLRLLAASSLIQCVYH